MNSSTPKRLDTKALESPIDTRDAVDWLACSTLGDTPPENLFAELCDRLCSAGLPLLRCHLSMRMLHPLLQSVDITWRRGQEFEVVPRPYSLDPQPWLQSPLY